MNFHAFLRRRDPKQKVLLWMDICHAGGYEGRGAAMLTAEDATQKIAQGTGKAVFASSTGRQLSQEGEQFGGGHGAFTAALLEALSGKADTHNSVGNKDQKVSISELHTYVQRRVSELTKGQQTTVVPYAKNLGNVDLAAVPK